MTDAAAAKHRFVVGTKGLLRSYYVKQRPYTVSYTSGRYLTGGNEDEFAGEIGRLRQTG